MRPSIAFALAGLLLAGVLFVKWYLSPCGDPTPPPPMYVVGGMVPELSEAEMDHAAYLDALKH